MNRNSIIDFVKRPPVLFPLVALFHIVWLLKTTFSLVTIGAGRALIADELWMISYTTFWLAATSMRRWGAWGYLLLTIVNIMLFYSFTNVSDKSTFVSSLFLLDILFSFFLLLHYKKLK